MGNPIAVFLSDVHFNQKNLDLASAALLKAQYKARVLGVPLVITGDLHDTKAMMRAEVTNRLIKMFSVHDAPDTIVLVGNHDLVNEKSQDHALNFLKPYCVVVDTPQIATLNGLSCMMVPYQSDPNRTKALLKEEDDWTIPKLLVMHQGLRSANAGDYIDDRSAIGPEDVAGRRVLSGHYHTRQTIALPDGGQWDYIGNPYTMTYGEANDPDKGFQILHDDLTLEFVPLDLRRHVVVNATISGPSDMTLDEAVYDKDDLVWIKVSGSRENLSYARRNIENLLTGNFKLTLHPVETAVTEARADRTHPPDMLDSVIDGMGISTGRRARLKTTWKQLCA